MTVSQLRKGLTPWELLLWGEFYKREHDAVKKLHAKKRK